MKLFLYMCVVETILAGGPSSNQNLTTTTTIFKRSFRNISTPIYAPNQTQDSGPGVSVQKYNLNNTISVQQQIVNDSYMSQYMTGIFIFMFVLFCCCVCFAFEEACLCIYCVYRISSFTQYIKTMIDFLYCWKQSKKARSAVSIYQRPDGV
jgi:hypothetical protein